MASRERVNLAASSVVASGVLRASVPIADPLGDRLFRAGTKDGIPVAGADFQCKSSAA